MKKTSLETAAMQVMVQIDSALALALTVVARHYYKRQAEATLQSVKRLSESAPPISQLSTVVEALVHAEDHRFHVHHGVDSRSIVRAAITTALTRRTQGGSTITQQLVRVVTGDYRRNFYRKFKELCLSSWLDSKVTKDEQAVAYLHVAYFGWRMTGIAQAANRLDIALPCTPLEAAAVVARLKYPEPRNPSTNREKQIRARQIHIIQKMNASREKSS
jgi:penicillin-binding protein 1A